LVTRQIYAGGGAFISDSKKLGFQISQRAQWIETVVNYNSSYRRPILHLKRPNLNETHLRVHITCGDPNKAKAATSLKIGTTAIVFACLSQGLLDDLNLEMVDPVEAFQNISATGTILVPLKRGDHLSALNIQLILLDKIEKLRGTIIKTEDLEWGDIMERWATVLEKFRQVFP
jgi:proteasome accessory factor A